MARCWSFSLATNGSIEERGHALGLRPVTLGHQGSRPDAAPHHLPLGPGCRAIPREGILKQERRFLESSLPEAQPRQNGCRLRRLPTREGGGKGNGLVPSGGSQRLGDARKLARIDRLPSRALPDLQREVLLSHAVGGIEVPVQLLLRRETRKAESNLRHGRQLESDGVPVDLAAQRRGPAPAEAFREVQQLGDAPIRFAAQPPREPELDQRPIVGVQARGPGAERLGRGPPCRRSVTRTPRPSPFAMRCAWRWPEARMPIAGAARPRRA